MRIAVSGTHCSGKTTLIEAFLRTHPDFAHEPEPYAVLVDEYGEEFSADPGAEDFLRQLQFNLERLQAHAPTENVIFERCPVDFLAYLLALRDLNREEVDSRIIEKAVEQTKPAMAALDLVVFVPLDDLVVIELPTEEDPKLRRAMNDRLSAFFSDDELGIHSTFPEVIEVTGSTTQRLRMVEENLIGFAQKSRA